MCLQAASTMLGSEPMNRDDPAQGLARVRLRIGAAARLAARPSSDITLVAVSKMQSADRIAAVLAEGQRHFGENRVQEALAKWPTLRERTPDVVLHLIGPLQTNKVRDALALFDVIETVDRPKLAQAIAKEMAESERRVPCFVEVNVGDEAQKAGVSPAELSQFLTLCRDELALPIAGLMCIPPIGEAAGPYFALLRKLAARHGLLQCSMGMSADFEDAIALGATSVRVGSGIFGERPGH